MPEHLHEVFVNEMEKGFLCLDFILRENERTLYYYQALLSVHIVERGIVQDGSQ